METRKKILVAEDNASNYKLLEMVLMKKYSLIHAWNGVEAVDLFEKNHPQLVLMDVAMPVMDGYEATRKIRKVSPTVPIIGLTAHAFSENEKEGYDSGMNEYLTKPLNISSLCSRISEILNG